MKLSEVTLTNTTDEGYVLAKALLKLGVADQEIEISSAPSHADKTYHPYTKIQLTNSEKKLLQYVEVPGVWGKNLIAVEGKEAHLIECATAK